MKLDASLEEPGFRQLSPVRLSVWYRPHTRVKGLLFQLAEEEFRIWIVDVKWYFGELDLLMIDD